MDKENNFIIPEYILKIWNNSRTKPIPSVWDFGFVTDEVFTITKRKPIFEMINSSGKSIENYYRTPDYDIYLKSSIEGYKLYLLYDSENKDSVIIAGNLIKKYKIKFEE